MPHHLRTERLLLRPLSLRDGAALSQAINDKAVLRNTGTWAYPATADVTRARLGLAMKLDPAEHMIFGIIWDGVVIGTIGLHHREGHDFIIGYMIGRRWWGQGIVSEAARLVCDFGFRVMKARRIIGEVFDDNPASVRVLKKLGFTRYKGSSPVWSIVRGRYDPGSSYLLTRERFSP